MIWFGSSAGAALSNMYPEAKSVALWLMHGWFVAVAYVVGFFVLLFVMGWSPSPGYKSPSPHACVQNPPAAAQHAIG